MLHQTLLVLKDDINCEKRNCKTIAILRISRLDFSFSHSRHNKEFFDDNVELWNEQEQLCEDGSARLHYSVLKEVSKMLKNEQDRNETLKNINVLFKEEFNKKINDEKFNMWTSEDF